MDSDPEHKRYKRNYPKFKGVKDVVEVVRRVQGAYLDAAMKDLLEHAPSHASDILEAYRAETDERVRVLLLSVLAEAQVEDAFPVLAEGLESTNESIQYWAVIGLKTLGTKEARRILWHARSYRLETKAATETLHRMLEKVLGTG